VRLSKTETSDTVDTTTTATATATAATTAATAAATTAATTANSDQTVKARARSDGNSDVLEYSATVEQAINRLQQLQHNHVSSSTTAQNMLYIEVCLSSEHSTITQILS
jgi:hypothetical protein